MQTKLMTRVVVVSRLQSRLIQLIDQLEELAQTSSEVAGQEPALDLFATEEGYRLVVEVPGVSAKHLRLNHRGTHVTVSGERGAEPCAGRYRCLERQRGPFERTVRLPRDADPERASARLDNGLLIVDLPRPDSAHGGRQIPIEDTGEDDS